MERSKKISVFGGWYYKQSKLERRRIIRELTEAGIPEMTIRSYIMYPRVPSQDRVQLIEQVTRQNANQLFPY